ncbi:MAG TPA: hypothetical protein VGY90_01265 [Steroidobacteraceae bacterium]|nr:hypothetical protein [Steroidobacteraceae bacterium]
MRPAPEHASRIGLSVIAFVAGGATALLALGVAFRAAPGVILLLRRTALAGRAVRAR